MINQLTIPVGFKNASNEFKWFTFLIDTGSDSSYINQSLSDELNLREIELENSTYSLSSASGQTIAIVDKKVTTDISINGKVNVRDCDLFLLPNNFESKLILGNDKFFCLRNLGINIFDYASEYQQSIIDNQFYSYEDCIVKPYHGLMVDCYLVTKVESEHVILHPFDILPGLKLEIPECVATQSNLKIIVMNNTPNYIEIKRGVALGTFEQCGFITTKKARLNLLRHVSELEVNERNELINEREAWKNSRLKILKNKVFTESDLNLAHLDKDDKDLILSLINAHKNIFAHSKTDRGFAPYQYDIDWKNNVPPPLENFFQRQYATAPSQRDPIKNDLNRLLELGVIEPASSAANIPMIAVIKSRPGDKNKVRLVLNFIQLNHSISERHFPIQSSNELLHNLGSIINKYNKQNKVGYFTSLDIRNAFHTIWLNRKDRLYTAFSFERSQYISKFLPFGLRSSPSTWCEMLHRILNKVLNKYEEILFYVDDLIIYSSKQKTIQILNEIFELFQENGLVLSADKASFLLDDITFLGKKVTRSGVSECDSQINKIVGVERPKTLKQLQKFLGMIAFVCNRIPNINLILKELYDLVGECQNRSFYWNESLENCFIRAKEAMNTSIETAHFDPNLPVFYVADTSDLGCGYAYGNFIQNDANEREYSICGIGSKVLPKNLLSSSTKIKELYGILIGLKEFRNRIVGCDITIFTDNFGAYKLIASNNWNDASIPRVVMNCFSVVEALQAKIEHMANSSKLLEFADAISRKKLVVEKQYLNSLRTRFIEQRPTINLNEIIEFQINDPDCQKLINQCKKNLITKFRTNFFKFNGQLLAGNSGTKIGKIVVSKSHAYQIIKFFHFMNLHTGTNKIV